MDTVQCLGFPVKQKSFPSGARTVVMFWESEMHIIRQTQMLKDMHIIPEKSKDSTMLAPSRKGLRSTDNRLVPILGEARRRNQVLDFATFVRQRGSTLGRNRSGGSADDLHRERRRCLQGDRLDKNPSSHSGASERRSL